MPMSEEEATQRAGATEALLALGIALMVKVGAVYEKVATDELATLADSFGKHDMPYAEALVTRVLTLVHDRGEGIAWRDYEPRPK